MKKLLIIFLSTFFCLMAMSQVDSISRRKAEIIIPEQDGVLTTPSNESLQIKLLPQPGNNTLKDNFFPGLKSKRQVRIADIRDSLVEEDPNSKALARIDSLRMDSVKKDSIKHLSIKSVQKTNDTSTYRSIMVIPYLPFGKLPVFMISKEKLPQGKDELFYLLTGLIFLIALIKLLFPKYFQNLFLLSFQTSFRQRQTREQLLQDNLASLMMNILFFISGGIYIGLIAQDSGYSNISFWELLLFCSLILSMIYAVKFLFLRFSGWVFNVKAASNTYIFIVFMINKIIGIFLVPFLLILAFSSQAIVQTAIVISLISVGILLLYRYLISLGTIRQDLKVNALHFFLYLCAVEILPLLLIYKVLFNYIGNYI